MTSVFTERVPMSALIPLIKRWAESNTVVDCGDRVLGNNSRKEIQQGSGWVGHLSRLSGVHVRTIARVMYGGQIDPNTGKFIDYVSFDLADKLVCAMDCPQEWSSGSLQEWYGPLGVKAYERDFEQPLYLVDEAA